MEKDQTVIEATVETPSFLRRIPVKKVAIVTLVVAAAIAVAKYAKDNTDVDVAEITSPDA